MRFSQKLHSTQVEEVPSTYRTSAKIQSRKFNQPLGFWHIRSHDRQTLIDDIIPYMAAILPESQSLRRVLQKYTWAEEFVKPEVSTMNQDENTCFYKTMAYFWGDPANTSIELLRLSRLWFFTLLRYTYRTHFFEGGLSSRNGLDLQDVCSEQNDRFTSELTNDTIQRLTRIQNRYGASFYRSCHKDTQQRLGWTDFCARVRMFCKSIGLLILSNNPEKNLEELRHNLTSIAMRRELSYASHRFAKNIVLVRQIVEDVKRLDKRVTSGAAHELDVIETTRQELQEMNRQMKELRLTPPAPDHSQQDHETLLVTVEKSQVAIKDEFEDLFRDIRESHETAKRLNELLQKAADQPQRRVSCSHSQKEDLITAESLVLCRWLLEHLPATIARHGMLSHRWKQFWQSQWRQGKEAKGRKKHPLCELVGEEKYDRIGEALYSTLSSRIHGYGQLRGEKLPPDVQRVVDVIKPIHFRKDGKINLEAERSRWRC